MEDVRDGDLRVPLISSLFFVLVIIGGIFLTFYVFLPKISQPWFPIVAFLLIGSPWAFWVLTYLYTCFKGCCCPREVSYPYDHHTYSRRASHVHSMPPRQNVMSSQEQATTNRPMPKERPPKPPGTTPKPPGTTNVGARHVHFGEVVVVESDGSKVIHEMDSWTNASKLVVEMPPDGSRSS